LSFLPFDPAGMGSYSEWSTTERLQSEAADDGLKGAWWAFTARNRAFTSPRPKARLFFNKKTWRLSRILISDAVPY
jgi:hypothetical protein